MRILITGASGFIGSRVLEKLIVKYGAENIIALSSTEIAAIKTVPSLGYRFNDRYLAENGCEDVNVLIHIGAFIPKAAKEADDIKLTSENITNTEKLLESFLPNLQKIVFISTIDVYEHCPGALSEVTKTVPTTMYGWSKLYCEQMILKHCSQKNLKYNILRLGHVYGEGEERFKKVMPIMIQNAIEGKDLNIYGDGEAIRSFIYIDDIAKAIVNSLELKSCEVINLVSNEPVTINQLAELIKSFTDKDISILHTPIEAPNINYVFDNTKMNKYLLKDLIPLQVGLKREYDYIKGVLKN